jgi:hypothetical protein
MVLLAAAPDVSATTASSEARRALVVPTGEDVVDAAIRAGAADEGVVVVDAAATQAVIADARAVGIACAPADGACWWRLAELGGFDVVVFVAGDVVTVQTASGPVTAAVAGKAAAAFTAATRRARGIAGEVRVRVVPSPPAGPVVAIDDVNVPVDGGLATGSVTAGTHRVVVRAPGFVAAERVVEVAVGAVVDVAVTLAPAEPSGSSSGTPGFVGGGIGVLAVTAVAVGGLLAWGQGPYLACYGPAQPPGCAPDGDITQTANTTAWAAVGAGVIGGAVGAGVIAVGLLVDEQPRGEAR